MKRRRRAFAAAALHRGNSARARGAGKQTFSEDPCHFVFPGPSPDRGARGWKAGA